MIPWHSRRPIFNMLNTLYDYNSYIPYSDEFQDAYFVVRYIRVKYLHILTQTKYTN